MSETRSSKISKKICELEPRQMGAETEMSPLPEPEMRVAGAGHGELRGIGEFAFVPIGGGKIEHDLVAGLHRMTGDFRVRERGAPHLHHRRHPADHLFDGIGNELRRTAQMFERVGLQAKLFETAGDQKPRGLVARGTQHHEIGVEFPVGQQFAIDLLVGEHRGDIVARLGSLERDQTTEEGEQFRPRLGLLLLRWQTRR